MNRVVIANSCGMLSALPTIKEFNALDFETEGKVFGAVFVSDADAALIYQERSRIRVLMPELPGPIDENGWLYVAVVNGRLVLV